MTTGASFHRGKSIQTYRTPDDFRMAVIRKFGMPHWDLAAEADTVFAEDPKNFYSEKEDAFTRVWSLTVQLNWLNPPFSNIAPWAKKCAEESRLGARILFLVPASVGSNWWAEYVHNHALVYFLRPRLCFDGIAPFPKDIALCYWGATSGFQCWKWK